MKKLHFICIAVLFCTCSVNTSAQAVHYVKINGTGNGSTWALASGDLQAAINAAQPGDQVWVASGTYFPNYNAENMSNIDPADRNNAIVLKEGIKVYGSFAGNENTLAERTATAIQDNPSILSGDLGTPGVATDNAYHIVISVGCTPATIFDGFTCTGGNANGTGSILIAATSVSREYGGALININSSPQFSNLTIIRNNAYIGGGGIYNESSLPS